MRVSIWAALVVAAAAAGAASEEPLSWDGAQAMPGIERSEPADIAVPEGKPAGARQAQDERRREESREEFIRTSKRDILRSREPREDCVAGLSKLEYAASVAEVLCLSGDPALAYGCFVDGMALSGGRRQDEVAAACGKFPAPQYCAKVVTGGRWESRDCFSRFGIASAFTCDRRYVPTSHSVRVRCDQL